MLNKERLDNHAKNLALGLVFSEYPEGWSFDDVIEHMYEYSQNEEVSAHDDLMVCETYQYWDTSSILDELENLRSCIYITFLEYTYEAIYTDRV